MNTEFCLHCWRRVPPTQGKVDPGNRFYCFNCWKIFEQHTICPEQEDVHPARRIFISTVTDKAAECLNHHQKAGILKSTELLTNLIEDTENRWADIEDANEKAKKESDEAERKLIEDRKVEKRQAKKARQKAAKAEAKNKNS